MIDLQQARREAAKRFYQIGLISLPEGWTFAFRKSLSGVCMITRKHIVAPKPVTRRALTIWLHECAHAHLHVRPTTKKRHVEEMEAEQWAFAVMRAHGIPVPRKSIAQAKWNVGRAIKKAERSGAKTIDPAARKFANGGKK